MPELLSVKAAKAIDCEAREKFGIPTLILMENAGSAVAREVLKSRQAEKKIAIFCGKGNNGGDGLVTARHLLGYGLKPDIYLAGEFSQVKNEAGINLNILLKLKTKITRITGHNLEKIKAAKYNLIIDALLGVGLVGPARGIYADLIQLINFSGADVIAVDIPSGLGADSGEVLGCCVKADKTVTFIARKQGMVIGAGPKYCGKIIVAGLGIGREVV